MSFKNDIQATRSAAAADATAIIAPPVRLRGIIIASDGNGAGVLELTTTSNSGFLENTHSSFQGMVFVTHNLIQVTSGKMDGPYKHIEV